MVVILAVDPGLARTGYALLRTDNHQEKLLDYGCFETKKNTPTPERIAGIYEKMIELMDGYHPDVLVIEELFFNRNVKTAIAVGQAQGAVLLAAAQNNLKSVWYTPGEVKQAVCGYGAASKRQVQKMVQQLLKLDHLPKPDDAADAVALAICHSAISSYQARLPKKRCLLI